MEQILSLKLQIGIEEIVFFLEMEQELRFLVVETLMKDFKHFGCLQMEEVNGTLQYQQEALKNLQQKKLLKMENIISK